MPKKSIKPFITYSDQINILTQKKQLNISDLSYAEGKLHDIGYYSLIDGYKDIFYNPMTRTYENGTKFIYSSLNDVKVNKGQNVKQGDVIALSGTSNYTENIGKSLHFEIIKEDTKLNPEKTYTKSIESL